MYTKAKGRPTRKSSKGMNGGDGKERKRLTTLKTTGNVPTAAVDGMSPGKSKHRNPRGTSDAHTAHNRQL
jgi:hypothetical protein